MKKFTLMLATAFMLLGLHTKAQLFRIKNEKMSDHFLNNETGNIAASSIQEGWWSAQWQFIPASEENTTEYCIVNRWTGCALEAQNDKLACNPFQESEKSQQWRMVLQDDKGYCSLQNVAFAKYLNEESSDNLTLESYSKPKSARWQVTDAEKSLTENNIPENTDLQPSIPPKNPKNTPNGGTTLSKAQIEDFLRAHNQVRSEVGIEPVKWNAKIAAYAEAWAKHLATQNNCQLKHRKNGNYGENIYQGVDITLSQPSVSVKAWADEKSDYKGGVVTWNLEAGHYTQLIWEKTTEIGCGLAVCPSNPKASYVKVISVCNYNPAGNVIGERPSGK